MPLTPEAKRLLAETIRGTQQDPEKGLRARLLRAIHDEAERQYRLSVPLADAGLDEAHRRRRERIEAWIDERARATKPTNKTELNAAKERLLLEAEKEAAATLINRLVLLRQLEAQGLSKPAVLTGGWSSKGYREFREFSPALMGDETEGYATLLQLLFDELAGDLPGLFGDVGLTKLFAIPPATLRDVVEGLDHPELVTAWTDDTTLGWVYQFWNDFERDALDAKALDGGKIEPHEIASKTQMFTDTYIVEWLLQNSLGLTWLAMCKKHGWTPDADRVLPALEERRAEWCKKREAGAVALDALMPIDGELERCWQYYVLQPIPDDAVEMAPESVRAIRILDPACGSGHFLVIAFDLLFSLYREEARHHTNTLTDKEIAESILENNLHGIDIDPRAIQIAAAALYLKAKTVARATRPKRVNLVAPVLQLGNLPSDDPAIVVLRKDLKNEVGIPEELTNKLLSALAGVDYLGSLLKVDAAVEDAIKSVELEFERTHGQGDLFGGFAAQQVKLSVGEAKASILDKLEQFLAKHSKSEDLGLRLDGEQIAAGVRFVRMAKEGTYDLVVGNPPYLGLSKTNAFGYVGNIYPKGKADLCTAFLERSLELTRLGGLSALVAMRAWMFLNQFTKLRQHLCRAVDLRTLGDLDKGAFESMPTSQLISVAMSVIRNAPRTKCSSTALQPTAPGEKFWGPDRTDLKRAAILAQRGRYEFDPQGFAVIEGEPIVYWWSEDLLAKYAAAPKLRNVAPVSKGLITSNDPRFTRLVWEVPVLMKPQDATSPFAPLVKGASGRQWIEPVTDLVRWYPGGIEVKLYNEGASGGRIVGEENYFRRGIAFPKIAAEFSARAYRVPSVVGDAGPSVFPLREDQLGATVCAMNASVARYALNSFNPTINFQLDDVNRLPLWPIEGADEIYRTLEQAFAEHESHREPSVEFKCPGPSPWLYAQEWAQQAVDRPDGSALPAYVPQSVPPDPVTQISFALGVALGRFSADGDGLLAAAPRTTASNGIVFVGPDESGSLSAEGRVLREAWKLHGGEIPDSDGLTTYLRKSFFGFHRALYQNRPIYFPLSSAKKSFVAFVSIHRWADDTLNVLLADHLVPTRRRLEGELDDLRTAKASGSNKGKAEKRFTEVQKLLEELNDFIAKVTEIAEKGPPPPDDKTTRREVDARYRMDLDDGVMVNSAALWPLLEPHWKDPKKWWKELANAQGKKHYDWSHVAARYFPSRVRKRSHDDPSLAVAHKCFWELHPAKAYAWELRLQDEIRPDFTIDEPRSDEARASFLKEHEREAADLLAKEMKRREKKAAKAEDEGEAGPLFEQGDDAEREESDD